MGKTILVTDDNNMTLRAAERILVKENYEVKKAVSGVACLEILQKETPDLLLLDMEMPGLSGLETLQKIRMELSLPHLPVVFLTGADEEEIMPQAAEFGVNGYLKKPFTPEELKECVKRMGQ